MNFISGVLGALLSKFISWGAEKLRALIEQMRLKRAEEKKNESIRIQTESAETKEEREDAARRVIDDFDRGGMH